MSASGSLPATLDGWLALIESRHPAGADGIDLGLDRVADVARRLGLALAMPVIVVGGTNGKGSTCAMLDAILTAAGYRTGRYSSPHLLAYNERVRIGGVAIDDASLAAAFARVERARGDTPLTYFEFGTLAAACVFEASALDAVIMEVGLGGRLDATNIFEPACCVVTTVDLDHQAFLGDNRESIGFEKAGIFRAGVPAICGDARPPASLVNHAAQIGAPLSLIGRDYGYVRQDRQWTYWRGNARRSGLALPALGGGVQLANAATAIAALEVVGDRLPVAMQDIRRGLIGVELPGRFQVLPGRPVVVLDVAHNPQAAQTLAANLDDMAFHPVTWAVFGMMADKDIDGVVAALASKVNCWLPVALPGRRSATTDVLCDAIARRGGRVAARLATTELGLAHALGRAGEADRILVFGSFLAVAGALRHLRRPA